MGKSALGRVSTSPLFFFVAFTALIQPFNNILFTEADESTAADIGHALFAPSPSCIPCHFQPFAQLSGRQEFIHFCITSLNSLTRDYLTKPDIVKRFLDNCDKIFCALNVGGGRDSCHNEGKCTKEGCGVSDPNRLPQNMTLAPHERILTVTMIHDIKVWLTTHRLVVWDKAVMVIPLTAIGPMIFTHRVYWGRVGWGVLLAVLAAVSGVGAHRLASSGLYTQAATGLVLITVLFGIAALVSWVRTSGPWLWTIYGSGGQVIEAYAVPRKAGEQVLRVAAQTADAIVRLLPTPQ